MRHSQRQVLWSEVESASFKLTGIRIERHRKPIVCLKCHRLAATF